MSETTKQSRESLKKKTPTKSNNNSDNNLYGINLTNPEQVLDEKNPDDIGFWEQIMEKIYIF
jgi:hypothetical protein